MPNPSTIAMEDEQMTLDATQLLRSSDGIKFPILFRQPHPLLFTTISGSHLYGFPSKDSDYDLRGAYVVPLETVAGLDDFQETITDEAYEPQLNEFVAHDIRKYFKMVLKNNGYVMEQIFSPLVVLTSPGFVRLRQIARMCLTKKHANHYLGFGTKEWSQFVNKPEKHVKRILYVFRVLLTGIFLQETGTIESNLVILNNRYQLPYIPDLIKQKLEGYETGELAAGRGLDFYQKEFERLRALLEKVRDTSNLPDELPFEAHDALNHLLLSLRSGKRNDV